jgi:hypothetical protein
MLSSAWSLFNDWMNGTLGVTVSTLGETGQKMTKDQPPIENQ